jgi:hypothetical protein
MKNLLQYINEHQKFIDEYCELLDEINFELITEAFGCKILKELVDQQTKMLDKWKDEEANRDRSCFTQPRDIRSIFRSNYFLWDKITDDQVQTFKGKDPEGVKLFKRICSNRSNSVSGIIIIESTPESQSKYKYSAIIIKEYSYINYYVLSSDAASQELKPSEVNDLIKDTMTYHIIVIEDLESRNKMRNQRSNSRNGVIEPGNEAQLRRLAEKNVERYKKLAAKMKVEKENNDQLPKKVEEIVSKVMQLSIEFAMNPVKYSSFEYEIEKLLTLVGDKQTSSYNRGKYNHYGINGLMYYFTSYMKSKLSIAKGDSYDFEQSDYRNAKKKLEELIASIQKKYDEIVQRAAEN